MNLKEILETNKSIMSEIKYTQKISDYLEGIYFNRNGKQGTYDPRTLSAMKELVQHQKCLYQEHRQLSEKLFSEAQKKLYH